VLCDRRLIGRSLANLVGNALKYTPSGGSVTLRAVCSGDKAGRPDSPHEARHGGAPPRQAAFS
ncbi:MAG: two-component sensor histidine kinase, partial [Elusimicrobia bacterium CG11_big_fil_rev_8_21_14_0_20_64_6]